MTFETDENSEPWKIAYETYCKKFKKLIGEDKLPASSTFFAGYEAGKTAGYDECEAMYQPDEPYEAGKEEQVKIVPTDPQKWFLTRKELADMIEKVMCEWVNEDCLHALMLELRDK